MISKSTFKIKPAALVERTKAVINNGIGLKNADDLAEDFQFIFPVVGPLSKGIIIKTLTTLTNHYSFKHY